MQRSAFALIVMLAVAQVGVAQTITVPGDYTTIQAAIDAVAPGGTILVAPGTYVEALIVDPGNAYLSGNRGQASFTIEGTGPGVIIQWPDFATVRQPGWNGNIQTMSGKQGDAILWARGTTGLTLRNLEFDGNDDMATNTGVSTSCGLSFHEASGSVEQCSIYGVQDHPGSGLQGGIGVLVEGASSVVAVTGCTMSEIQKNFFTVGSDGCCNITDSTLTGRGATGSIAQNAIQYSFGGKGAVSGCTIDGFWWTGPNFVSTGALVYFSGSPVSFTNNTFIDCQVGIYDIGDDTTPLSSQYVGNTFNQNTFTPTSFYPAGILIAGDLMAGASSVVIQNNQFNGLEDVGVGLFDVTGVTVTGNYFNGNGSQYNYFNAQDENANPNDNNWDGNTWSDYATNSGFPGAYVIPGNAMAVDGTPSGGCADFAATDHAVGTTPTAVALGDTDGDGDLDIAVTNAGSDDVTVLENDGDGGFTPAAGSPIALSAGDAPAAIAIGDVTGMGDLIIACPGNDVVRVVGMAPSTIAIPAGTYDPSSLCVTDLDGAGPDDVVIGLEGDVILGGGGVAVSLGGASPAVLLPAPVGGFLSIKEIACCDLDGDGDEDIVAAMGGSLLSPSTADNVLLYENDGAGNFTLGGALSALQNPVGVCCGDLDGDGDADLAVTVESFPSTIPGGMLVFTNGGLTAGAWNLPGDFTAAGPFSSGLLPSDLICADLGNDGLPGYIASGDVLTVNFGTGNLTRYTGWDGSSFVIEQSCSAGVNPVAVAVGQLDLDHTPDVVVVNLASETVTVLASVPQALAQKFGTGCQGSNGMVPSIQPVGAPSFNSVFGVRVTQAKALAPVLLGVSAGLDDFDLGGGCTLYLQQPVVTFQLFTNLSGEATFSFLVPPDVAPYAGLDVFFQYAVFDPGASLGGILALSDALRVKFGQ